MLICVGDGHGVVGNPLGASIFDNNTIMLRGIDNIRGVEAKEEGSGCGPTEEGCSAGGEGGAQPGTEAEEEVRHSGGGVGDGE